MATGIEVEKMRADQVIREAVQETIKTAPLRAALRAGAQANVTSNGFWTEDENGNSVFQEHWKAGDAAGSAPV